MDGIREIEEQALEFEKLEEIFEDMYHDVFKNILSYGPFDELKSKIQAFKDQLTNLRGVYHYQFHHFFLTKP